MCDYYSFGTEYGAADEFFKAVMSLDKTRVEQLKASGATLTEGVKNTLLNGGGSMMSNKPETRLWYLYLSDLENVGKEGFVYISRAFFEETGAPLYYSDALSGAIFRLLADADVFSCLLDCYDQKKMNKKRLMQNIILKNNAELLEICAKHGWLKQANKRDELIEYANAQNKTECTAWLLDYKNRTADLSAERAKAEKKMERELNAAPDSALELGKIWSWKKQEDGTLIITSFKGIDATEVTIPAKIGNNLVTAVADEALSYNAPRATNKMSRLMIERVIVPNGIKTLGNASLGGVGAWRKDPRLKEVVLPETLDIFNDKEAAESAPNFITFYSEAVAVIPRMENAIYYCTKNSMKYRFSDEGEDKIHIPSNEVIKSDALYSAIIAEDKEKYAELKKSGAVLTDYIKNCLLHEMKYGNVLYDIQRDFFKTLIGAGENIEFILSSLKAETGEPLYFDKYRYSNRSAPERFDCILEYFNTKFLDRIGEMRQFILDEKIEHLAVCAKHGWLKNTATRDKLIAFSSENNKTEATAWLLDFKNRTADLAAEQKRAEKRLERQLNAPPPTPEELREKTNKLFKRTYNYEEANGEIKITGYKGKDVEVEIPREFDGKPITAIGRHAFSPRGKGVPTEHRRRRESITRVVFPDTLREIGDFAFLGCGNLKEVVIPGTVTRIGSRAFLTHPIVMATTLIVERGSLAEEYGKANSHNIKYINEE